MISSPVYYYRQYEHDIPAPPCQKQKLSKVKSVLVAALPILSFIPPVRTPLSVGHIEILTICMLLQIAFKLHKAIVEFRKGNYLEGTCHLITSVLTLSQVVPQMRVIDWKWRTHPPLKGELCRDERGFIYLKVKDEIIFELNKIFGNNSLPPYFGEGKHGAHVTVIPVGELGKDVPISEIGKTIKFNIAFC
ncbi:MAG: hypothetical protein KDK55_03715 [Chlamydiia bacterium]|nr:hypothetical protein [Chlamydiia bacterium]